MAVSLATAAPVEEVLFEARRMCANDSLPQALMKLEAALEEEGWKKQEEYLLNLEKGDILLYYARLPEHAAKVYEGLIKLGIPKGKEGEIYYRLGLALERSEQFSDAARAYEKVVTDYSDSPYYDDALSAIERCFLKNYEIRVAYVDSYPISQLELDEIISKLSPVEQKDANTPEGRKKLVDRVVYERLLKLAARDEYAPSESTEVKIKLSCQSCRPKEIMIPNPLTDSSLVDQLTGYERRMLLGKLYNMEVVEKVDVTEKEMKKFYKDSTDKFVVLPKYTIREIVTDSVNLDSVLAMLEADVPFDSVAKTYSTAPTKDKGGLLESRFLSGLSAGMQPVAETLSVGTVSEPYWTTRGWEIILLEDRTEKVRRPYDEVASWIEDMIKRGKMVELSESALNRFRASAALDTLLGGATLAKVAGTVITESDIDAYIESLPMKTPEQEQDTILRKRILAQMIDDKVFGHELAQQKLFLADSLSNLIESNRRQTLVNNFMQKEVESKTEVGDEEIETYYKEHKQEFWKPAEAKVREILVASEDTAKMIYELISEGVKFDSLARTYSKAETAQRSGYVGYIKKDESGKPYEKQAFKAKDGTVTKPIKTDEGYWLVSVEAKKKAYQQTLEQSQSTIRQKISQEKKEAAETALRERLTASAQIEIIEEPPAEFPPPEEPGSEPDTESQPEDVTPEPDQD